MRFRFTLLAGVTGLLASGYLMDVYLAAFTVFAMFALHSLRCIEYQIGDLKGRIPGQKTKDRKSFNEALAIVSRAYQNNHGPEMRDRIYVAFNGRYRDEAADLEEGIAFKEKLDLARELSAATPERI